MGKNTKYTFIKNQPLGEDLFSNKSQDKIATVISDKIIKEHDFKIIGIDGEWGSGKSNLVKLIEKKLEISHKFFVYDVWGHQEDEQRKSILIELTEFIKSESNLVKKRNNWDNKLKLLLAKSKETKTINQPYLSIGFIFSLLSIIYIPTVNVFKDTMVDFFEIKRWYWKLLLVTFPILIVIGIYLWNLVKNWINRKGFCKSFKLSAEETFQVYTNKQREETKIETISESEPSVREFQKWMQEINDDLKIPIIIVFDNFDRLPKKHILSIWSSIHIFFAENGYSNIKVIIPFDREHIQNAFKDLNNGENKSFGEDYVNKTFDIVFRVTKPIMSDWKKFFEEQWKKAFTECDEIEMNLVIQVYEFLNRRITPREIISFINEVLTIKFLDEKYKERYIGIFILQKDKILENPLKAVSDYKEILGGLYHIYSNDKEYPKQLTAIIYHIEVDKALELIYTQELRESMLKNDVQKFNEICKADFIDSIFYSAIKDVSTFENPILALDSLDKDTKVSTQHIEQIWSIFYDRILGVDKRMKDLVINDWQISLIKNILDNRYLSKLLENYFELIDDTNIEKYIDLIDKLISCFTEERVLNNLIENEISEENYVKLVEYKAKEYNKYKLSVDYNLLDDYLSKLDTDKILQLKEMRYLPKDYDFKKYREKLKTALNNFSSQNNIQSANDILVRIKEIIRETGELRGVLGDDRIGQLYANHKDSKWRIIYELIAMRIARGNSFNPSYISYFDNVLNTEDTQKADPIAHTILNYTSYGDLLLSSEYLGKHPLFRQIILLMFKKSNLGKKVNIISLINKYQDIKEALQIDDNSLLKELNKWKIEKLNVNTLDNEFLSDCFKNEELEISNTVSSVFNEDFSNLDKEDYEKVFDNTGNDVHFKFFQYLKDESLTQLSLDVFETRFIEMLEQNSNIKEQWWNILENYDTKNSSISIINLLKNILGKITNSKIELSLEITNKLLPYFFKYNLLTSQKDVFRLVIKNEFLSDTTFIKLLIENSEKLKELYRIASKEDKDGFGNLLNEQRDSNVDIDNLAKSIDIRRTKEK
ncbi:P-loop NTPase fold protein [Capnocytophaga gingivalis]|uniref:P-loop NTPase fold protein n=1 Tax=Capnocytophaga gingivalis TaxID=1017 RepID=UPI0028D24738|nr:P-loop NTPase fold protein [Capnocytophaga gingivalis]